MNPRRPRVFLAYAEAEFKAAYPPPLWSRLTAVAEVARHDGTQPLAGPDLARAAAGCELVIGFRSTPCDAGALEAMPALLGFLRAAVDLSTVDVAAASRLGILVTQVSPGFHDAVAELGIGLLLDLARGVTRHRLAPSGGHGLPPPLGRELRGATLGFIGYGGIARRMKRLAEAFGMRTLAHDPLTGEADLPLLPLRQMLPACDFVVCLAASNAETRRLVDADTFAAFKPGAHFVNLSRGELVDEDALEAALNSGHLAGAALDVGSAADQKPAPRFLARRDVVVTQHIGGSTQQARERQTLDTIEQVEAIARGEMPRGAVNPQAATRLQRFLS